MRENEDRRRELLELLKASLTSQREGIHVSDLLYPLKAFWRRKAPQPLSDEKALLFTAGRGHHALMEMVSALPEYREVKITWAGITGTLDVFKDRPVEIKTTRALNIDPHTIERDHPEWLRQLRYYCAMLGAREGELWVFSLGGSGSPPQLRVFTVEVEDPVAVRVEMIKTKEMLESALASGDPSQLPPCPEWMCRGCEYREEHCKPLLDQLEKSLLPPKAGA